MADDAGPSHTMQSIYSREAVGEIVREMVVETDHNLIEALNSATRYYYNHYHKVLRNISILSGRVWMYELFNRHQGRFEDAVSMSKPVFLLLCDALHSFGLTLPQREHGVLLEEKVAVFICALQGMDWKDLQERFQHLKETLSRNFHEVLQAMIPFTSVHSRSLTPEQMQQGGHPHLQSGKYYLVDSGHSNKTGYLAPYKGYRYHQNAHRNRRPQNEFELFNKAHSSLRSCIERTFSAWKSRWGALRNIQKLSFSNQMTFVCASMALHNFIRRNSQIDEVTLAIPDSTEYMAPEMPDHDEYARVADVIEEGDSDPAMAAVRANITYQLRQQLNTNI
ncbi:unnamed protein product [Camellia sinensis]